MTNTTTETGRPLVAALLAAMAALALILGAATGAQAAGGPDLALKKTVDPESVRVGDTQIFTIKITNEGTAHAEGVRMRDPLPSRVRFVRASTSRHVPGSCGIEDRVVKCRLGTLRVDRTVTVKIYVKPIVAGSYTNRAYVTHDGSGARALELGGSDNFDAARALVEAG